MAGVFRDVTMEWDGEDYVFTPSNRILRRIEGQGVNIAVLIHGLSVGPVSAPDLAFVAAEFLKIGGADVNEDQIYAKIMGGTEKEIGALATAVTMALVPQAGDEKKPQASARKSKSKRSRTKRKK